MARHDDDTRGALLGLRILELMARERGVTKLSELGDLPPLSRADRAKYAEQILAEPFERPE